MAGASNGRAFRAYTISATPRDCSRQPRDSRHAHQLPQRRKAMVSVNGYLINNLERNKLPLPRSLRLLD